MSCIYFSPTQHIGEEAIEVCFELRMRISAKFIQAIPARATPQQIGPFIIVPVTAAATVSVT